MKKDNTKMRLMTLLVGFLLSLPVLSAAGASEYYPMLVEGRTWKYSECRLGSELPGLITFEGGWSFGVAELKIQGDTIVDGTEYKKVYLYYDKSETPYKAKPYYLAREDKDEKSVYIYYHDYSISAEREIKVYDFNDMSLVDEDYWWCAWTILTQELTPYSQSLLNGIEVNGFVSVAKLGFFEGIGWVGRESDSYYGYFLYFDNFQCFTAHGMQDHDDSYLYSVCEADGTEIFAIEEHRPEVMRLETVRAESTDSEAAAVYYRFDGVRFDRRPSEPGIYIRVAGGEVSKVVI